MNLGDTWPTTARAALRVDEPGVGERPRSCRHRSRRPAQHCAVPMRRHGSAAEPPGAPSVGGSRGASGHRHGSRCGRPTAPGSPRWFRWTIAVTPVPTSWWSVRSAIAPSVVHTWPAWPCARTHGCRWSEIIAVSNPASSARPASATRSGATCSSLDNQKPSRSPHVCTSSAARSPTRVPSTAVTSTWSSPSRCELGDGILETQLGSDRARCCDHQPADPCLRWQGCSDPVHRTDDHRRRPRPARGSAPRRGHGDRRPSRPDRPSARVARTRAMRRRSPTDPSVGKPSAVHAARPPMRSITSVMSSISNRRARADRSQCWSKQ